MARRKKLRFRALLAEYRQPLLLSAALLILVLCCALLPEPTASIDTTGLKNLELFAEAPNIRVLVKSLGTGERINIEGKGLYLTGYGRELGLEVGRSLSFDGRGLRASDQSCALPASIRHRTDDDIEAFGHRWPGTLHLIADGSRLRIVNEVPLETYIAGVISKEMGLSFPSAALQAQAVAARSYAVIKMRTQNGKAWDLSGTQSDQVYQGRPRAYEKLAGVVRQSRALVMSFEGRVLNCLYSSTCGGHTRAAGDVFGGKTLAPLAGVRCGFCEDSPLYRWRAESDWSKIRHKLGLGGSRPKVASVKHGALGLVRSISFRTSAGRKEISASSLRKAMRGKVRSSLIDRVETSGNRVIVVGRGFGHAVGLCQYGARGQALKQRSAREILEWYYPEASLVRAW